MNKVALSPTAKADLREIVAFIAEDSPKSATRLLEDFSSLCELLNDNPMLGRLSLLKTLLNSKVRVCAIPEFSNYLVYYRILPKMEIARVLHGARDIEELF